MNDRQIALDILQSTLQEKTYLNLALKKGIETNISDKSRRFITALVNTTIENLFRIDYILSSYIKGKRVHSVIRNILRLGVSQLFFFENVPVSAAVNESVKLAELNKKKQLKGFVNAVLRKIADNLGDIEYPDPNEDFAEYLHIIYSVPLWLCKKYIKDYGQDFTEQLLSYKADNSLTCMRRNYFVNGEVDINLKQGRYLEDAFYIKNATDLANSQIIKSGIATVQSEASMLCVRAAGIKKNDRVLDLCAAPGGKSSYAAWFANEGEVLSTDLHEHRVKMIESTRRRLKIPNLTAAQLDATEFNGSLINKFDVVLVDAPCSALGLMYRKPDIRIFKTADDIETIVKTQQNILKNAAKYVKLGGVLLYSTCTINKDENQNNIELFLKDNKDFSLQSFADQMPEELKGRSSAGMVQLFPYEDGIDGFFIAKLKKENECIS